MRERERVDDRTEEVRAGVGNVFFFLPFSLVVLAFSTVFPILRSSAAGVVSRYLDAESASASLDAAVLGFGDASRKRRRLLFLFSLDGVGL